MSNKKIFVIYTFLFVIPYLLCLSLIATGYNALVNHYNSWWRLAVCAVVGAILMVAVRSIAQRPITIITKQTTNRHLRALINFFNIDHGPKNFYCNFAMDFGLTIILSLLLHHLVPLYRIQGTLIGWIIVLLIFSLILASNLEYQTLSIDPPDKEIK